MHFHPTYTEFLVGGFLLILGIIFAIAAFLETRGKKPPPFRSYYCTEYDDNPFQSGSFSEDEHILTDAQARFQHLSASHPGSANWRFTPSDSGLTNRESD